MEFFGWCIRIDAIEGYKERITMLTCHKDYESIIAVQHMGSTKENMHYHLVIKTKVEDQAMRVRMRKIFDKGKGNGHMSQKRWDGGEDAISYLFHEDPNCELLLSHNITEEQLKRCRERNLDVRKLVEEAKNKASCKLEPIVFKMLDRKCGHSNVAIAKLLFLTALRMGKHAPNAYQCKRMVASIQFQLCDGNAQLEERLAEAFANEVYRFA
jgi:hypothetical protein